MPPPPPSSAPPPPPPTPQSDIPSKLLVGYYTNWAQYRNGAACSFDSENDIDPTLYTHINYAFGVVNPDFTIGPYEWNDEDTTWGSGMYTKVNEHKLANPSLKTLLSLGGWNFNVKEETKWIFSSMVSTEASRKIFIDSCIEYATHWGFDGIDIDWEYPGYVNNGGDPANDRPNFTLLLQEFRQEIDSRGIDFLLTLATAAGESIYSIGYDLDQIGEYTDFVNIMTYDLHGYWDSCTGPNTGMDELDEYSLCDDYSHGLTVKSAIEGYISRGFPAKKLVLGMGTYGRSFTLADPNVHAVGSPAIGPGQVGPCTGELGYIGYREIKQYLADGWQQEWDPISQTPYAHSGTQWIGYDNIQSLDIKVDYVEEMGLGGGMVWAMDLDTVDYELISHLAARLI